MQIIGLAGPSGSGKSTVGDILHGVLCDQGYSSVREAFARPIKQAARSMLGSDGWVDKNKLREWMQNYGTKMREQAEDYWIRHLMRRVVITIPENSSYPPWLADFVIITDVRYPNEAQFCDQFGVVWYVDGDHRALAGDAAAHESESHCRTILAQYVDTVIKNNRGLEELAQAVAHFVHCGCHRKQERDHGGDTGDEAGAR